MENCESMTSSTHLFIFICRPRSKNSKGQGHFFKGHFKKRARGVDFLEGIQGHSKRAMPGTNSNNYFPMGHIHRNTTGHQGHMKKGHFFKCTNIWKGITAISEGIRGHGLGLIRALHMYCPRNVSWKLRKFKISLLSYPIYIKFSLSCLKMFALSFKIN